MLLQGNQYALTYEGKICKSPTSKDIIVPSEHLAALLLAEWRNLLSPLKERPAPMSSLIYRALELGSCKDLKRAVVQETHAFIHTDTLCFLEPNPEIGAVQQERWSSFLQTLCNKANLPYPKMTHSIDSIVQDPELSAKCMQMLEELDHFALSGFETLTRSLKSYFLSLGLYLNLLSTNETLELALLEYTLQTDKWGIINESHTLARTSLARITNLAALCMYHSRSKLPVITPSEHQSSN